MSEPIVVISILNWNNFKDTIRCIHSVRKLCYKAFEIVIVDNHSGNESISQIKKAFPDIEIIKSPENKGYASGHKLAVDYGIQKGAELVWLVNNDVEVNEDSLKQLVDVYKRRPDSIFGSITIYPENNNIVSFGGGKFTQNYEEFDYNSLEGYPLKDYQKNFKEHEVQTVEGSSILIPLSVIKKFGFMNESYFMYVEETDYCYYLRTKNISSVIVPKSVVIHKSASSSFINHSDISYLMAYYRRRNHLLFMKKYYHWTNKYILTMQGGTINLLKFFCKHYFFSNKGKKEKNKTLYYINIGTIHAIFAIKGKTIKPERFIHD